MRKLPIDLENPVDNYILKYGEQTLWFYRYFNFTPNMLTTLSLLYGLLSVVLFHIDYRISSSLCFMISYYFDCMDGAFARQFNMVTYWGDIYDHVSDNVKGVLFFVAMYYKNYDEFLLLTPFIVFFIGSILLHLGCQEVYHNKKHEAPSLKFMTYLCFTEPTKIMKYTRYVSCGTGIALMSILILVF